MSLLLSDGWITVTSVSASLKPLDEAFLSEWIDDKELAKTVKVLVSFSFGRCYFSPSTRIYVRWVFWLRRIRHILWMWLSDMLTQCRITEYSKRWKKLHNQSCLLNEVSLWAVSISTEYFHVCVFKSILCICVRQSSPRSLSLDIQYTYTNLNRLSEFSHSRTYTSSNCLRVERTQRQFTENTNTTTNSRCKVNDNIIFKYTCTSLQKLFPHLKPQTEFSIISANSNDLLSKLKNIQLLIK